MGRQALSTQVLGVCVLGVLFASCGDDCRGVASCPSPLGITVTISSASGGGPIDNAIIRVSGTMATTIACGTQLNPTVCIVPVPAGTYTLDVEASGFRNAQRTVTVPGGGGGCGCGWVTTQFVEVSLPPM